MPLKRPERASKGLKGVEICRCLSQGHVGLKRLPIRTVHKEGSIPIWCVNYVPRVVNIEVFAYSEGFKGVFLSLRTHIPII